MAIREIFPTEIYISNLGFDSDFNTAIFNQMMLKKTDQGHVNDPLSLDCQQCEELATKVQLFAKELCKGKDVEIIGNWSTIYRPGELSSIPMHKDDHYFSEFIGIYYLFDVDPDDGGNLNLYDPRWVNPYLHGEDKRLNLYEVKPESSLLVIFPSFLYHSVSNFNGKNFRTSINMAIKLTDITKVSSTRYSDLEY